MCRSSPCVVLELHVAQANFQGNLLPLCSPHVADGRAREALVRPCRRYRVIGGAPVQESDERGSDLWGCVAFAWAFLWVFLRLASFPGLPRLQFLIACSVQKRSWLRFAYCKRSKAGFPPSPHQLPHQRWKAGQGLVLRQRGYWNILPMKNISLSFCSALEKEFFFSKAARQNLEWKLRLENCYCSDMYVCSLLIGNTHECTHITEYLHVYHY